jgi:DNA-binding XRE family transcriptional regulator
VNRKLIGKRNEKGLSQRKMAELIGISNNNYCLKEQGKLEFHLDEIKKILEILNCSFEDIF